jgi:hypothetical protein
MEPGRFFGGAPDAQGSDQILAAGDELEIAKLVAGTWKVRITWHAPPILAPRGARARRRRAHRGPAAARECIDGQTEEQWKRAGKEFPHAS